MYLTEKEKRELIAVIAHYEAFAIDYSKPEDLNYSLFLGKIKNKIKKSIEKSALKK